MHSSNSDKHPDNDSEEAPPDQAPVKQYGKIQEESLNTENKVGAFHLGVLENEEEEDETFEDTSTVEMDLFRMICLMAKSKQLAAVFGLLGGCLVHLIVGAIYRWNMITEHVGIYFGTSIETPVGAPLSMLCAGLTMRLGYKLSDSFGSLCVLGVAMTTAVTGALLASLSTSFIMFLLGHNVIFGMSAGLLFLLPLKECHKFFPRLKLVTTTIILTGTGLGAVLFGAYNIECIENGEQTLTLTSQQMQSLVDSNFSECFIKMSAMMLVVGFGGILMMVPMLRRSRAQEKAVREVSEERGNFCRNECQAFRSRVFWVMVVVTFLSSCGNFYVIMNFYELCPVSNPSNVYLYWLLVSGALGNSLARLVWGFISSRVGFKTLFATATLLNIASFLTIMLGSSPTLYLIFYTINSATLGGLLVIIPNVAYLIFGKKIGQSIYSYYWIAFSLGNFLQLAITLVVTENPHDHSDYAEVLLFFALCTLVAAVLSSISRLQGPWKNPMDLINFRRSRRRAGV